VAVLESGKDNPEDEADSSAEQETQQNKSKIDIVIEKSFFITSTFLKTYI
jgi:hypothetical protein